MSKIIIVTGIDKCTDCLYYDLIGDFNGNYPDSRCKYGYKHKDKSWINNQRLGLSRRIPKWCPLPDEPLDEIANSISPTMQNFIKDQRGA